VSVSDIWGIGHQDPEFYAYSVNFLPGKDQFKIDVTSVVRIFNNITGLMSQQRASIFIINVTKGGDSIDYYNRLLGVQNSKALLQGLRYMVQQYIMGGLYSTEGAN
jgi:hypothetical protein